MKKIFLTTVIITASILLLVDIIAGIVFGLNILLDNMVDSRVAAQIANQHTLSVWVVTCPAGGQFTYFFNVNGGQHNMVTFLFPSEDEAQIWEQQNNISRPIKEINILTQ